MCVCRTAAAGSLFLGAGFSVCLQHSARRAAFAPRFISNSGPFLQHFPPQLAVAFVRMVFQNPGGKIQSVPAHTTATNRNNQKNTKTKQDRAILNYLAALRLRDSDV